MIPPHEVIFANKIMRVKLVPTDLELEILMVIWERREATVREVFRDIIKKRKLAYTTVSTMIGILERKEYLAKRAGGRAHIYTPAIPREQVLQSTVDDFVDRVFNGSALALFVHLVENREIDSKTFAAAEAVIRDRRKM